MYVSLENTHTQLWIHTMSQIQIHPHKFLSRLPHSTFIALLLHSDNTCSHQCELMHLLLTSLLNLKGCQKGFSQKTDLLERVQDMFAVLSISPALQDCVYLVQYPVFINNFNQLFPSTIHCGHIIHLKYTWVHLLQLSSSFRMLFHFASLLIYFVLWISRNTNELSKFKIVWKGTLRKVYNVFHSCF